MWRFHTEIGTFQLSCMEYAVFPLDWTAILGIRFGGYPISIDDTSFEMACELLSIPFPFTTYTRAYFRPTASPKIRIEWL